MRKLRRQTLVMDLGLLALAIAAAILSAYFFWPRRIVLSAPAEYNRKQDDDPSSRVVQMFGGEAGLSTIRQPDRVEAFRILDDSKDKATDFQIQAGPVRLAQNDISAISAALLSPASYGWEYVKGCLPDYGVCLSFFRGSDRVDVVLCLECQILLIGHNGVITGGEDFDPINPLLVRTVKELFPGDKAIQALGADDESQSPGG